MPVRDEDGQLASISCVVTSMEWRSGARTLHRHPFTFPAAGRVRGAQSNPGGVHGRGEIRSEAEWSSSDLDHT